MTSRTPLTRIPHAYPLDFAPGATIAGKYRLIRPIGAGGMGAVWRACNEATGAEVALKIMLPHDDLPGLRTRFHREATTTARLCHPGIVRIYDLLEVPVEGETVSTLVLVMELLHGRTLAALLHERTFLTLDEALAIMMPVLSALAYAHEAGIVHRDLKPENIFLAVDSNGVVTPKIVDFGISKASFMTPGSAALPSFTRAPAITRAGEIIGTPSYMSPEQVRGRVNIGAQSDIFNVGILLYEMLAGHNPFAARSLNTMIASILEDRPEPIASVPGAVWSEIERALRKSPTERHATVGELAVALRVAAALPITPAKAGRRSDDPSLGFARWRARPPWRALMVAAVAVGIASGASLAIAQAPHANARVASALLRAETETARTAVDVTPPVPTIPDAPPVRHQIPDAPVATFAPSPVVAAVQMRSAPRAPNRRIVIARDPGF